MKKITLSAFVIFTLMSCAATQQQDKSSDKDFKDCCTIKLVNQLQVPVSYRYQQNTTQMDPSQNMEWSLEGSIRFSELGLGKTSRFKVPPGSRIKLTYKLNGESQEEFFRVDDNLIVEVGAKGVLKKRLKLEDFFQMKSN